MTPHVPRVAEDVEEKDFKGATRPRPTAWRPSIDASRQGVVLRQLRLRQPDVRRRVIDPTDYTYDDNGDGLMYVEVQAQDGKRSTRLRVLVERQVRSSGIKRDGLYSYGS